MIKQVMIYFGDIHPFLTENEDIGPALRPKLLIMLNDPQKNALIQLEMADAVDWGEQKHVTVLRAVAGLHLGIKISR